ncbi:MAG TPA: hypothetical protein VJ966_10545 [Actinomycetes bacterium]|nr:hypothetical protein [Actinomycetes bacterium]
MAHEITHVLQHERAGGREAGTVRRQPRSDDPAAEDWSRFEAAFQDPNLIAHQRALQELATKRSPRAFDLILSRVNDPWDADHAMEAALAFFIFYPDLALDRLEPATQPAGDAAVTALNGLLAYRASAHGPGPDVAYRKLDAWMAAKDAKEGGALTRSLQRRQVRVTVERMRQTIATSSRIRTRALPGAAAFVQEMDQLLTALPNLAERDVASLHATVMAADPLVSRAESRVDELYALIGTLIVDQNVPADADEIKFIEEELIKPYDDALAKGRDFAAMARLVATADAAYRNQALLYQARKVKQLREGWSKVKYPEVGWPVKNASGMRAGGLGIEQKYTAHVASLTPRVESLLKRHDAGERLPVADLAEVQRDLLTVQLEQAALSDYLSLFLLYEQLVQIEPKGASSHVVSDFDDIKADVRRWNGTIERAVIGGNLKGYVELTDNVDYRIVFKRAQRRAETIEDQQLALAIGVLAVSFLAGWGAGLLVRGGATLAFGAEAVAAGSFGARVLAGAEFVGNVAAFTLTSEALQSATFGTKFDAASLPGKMAENAVMFWVFGRIGKLTGGIGKGATGPLMKVLGFGLRQSVNLALFTGVGALGERVLHGQWPRDWKRFMVQSVAAYAMLSVLGKTLEPLRAKLDQRLLEPVVAKRLATLDARLEALGQQLADMTGTSSATGEATVKRSQGEALRQRIKELCGDYRKLLDFLKTSGAIKAAEADPLYDSLAQTEKAMTDAVLTAERASIVALDRIGELRPTGDGVNFTYQARRRAGRGRRSRAPSGLDKALTAFGAAGYEIETNAESGEIAVYQPGRGELVARFTPDIGAIPEAAAKGKPARTPKEVMQFLRDAGFSESEIISFGGADAKRLGSRSAARVSRLAEKFTLEDLKALAQVLWKYDVVLTDAMADQLLKLVEAGRMEAFLRSREAAAESAASVGLDVDFEESLGLSVEERGVRKPRKAAGDRKFDAPWRLAEKHTGAALEATFGGGWVAGRRFFAPTAAEGELLGSTVPEYYRKSDNTAVEVKRWNLAEMGIDPARADRPRGAPSTRSVEALGRARRQQENRRWALPGEAEGVPPAKTWIVLDIRAQGVTDPAATGANLKTLLADYKIVYDKVMVLTEGGLLEIK